jgi:hypothetical protein
MSVFFPSAATTGVNFQYGTRTICGRIHGIGGQIPQAREVCQGYAIDKQDPPPDNGA